jgi:hypothetical protein
MFAAAMERTYSQEKNNQSKYVGMEEGLSLKSHAWRTTPV